MEEKRYSFTQNREISWLRFNQRVLEEASDPRVPLLERLKFLAIFTSNLDEFFMVRCGSLYDQMLFGPEKADLKSGMTPAEQLQAIYKESRKLYTMRDTVYRDINKTLQELFLANSSWKNLTRKQQKFMQQEFEKKILPLLSPQIIDARHPFPHLINKEQYVFCELQMNSGKKRYGIIPIPSFLERVITIPDTEGRYMLVEQLILQFTDKVFPKSRVLFRTIIRVTRNADINLNEKDIEEDEDYRQYMKKILKKRSRLSAIRLEFYRYTSPDVVSYLCSHLHISEDQVFVSRVPLEMKHLFSVVSSAPAAQTAPLLYQPFKPQSTTQLDPDRPLIPQIQNHDVMLFYPYQDIGLFLKLLKEAARDKNVLSIRITIYRLADNSKVVDYLVEAAENGKDVLVLMELRARFDESNNIRMAERLENAGCTVIYGFENYKVHSKICLITYQTHGQIRTITQIGTGNYNEKTSRQYTDLSLMTGDPVIGQDAIAFFQNMQTSDLSGNYRKLLTSPHALKEAVMKKIDHQIELAKAGQPSRIMLKMNSVTDLDLIAKLRDASASGVPVIMVVRGICCLLPGIPHETDNIEIFSIVGRFLEHSRIYIFGTDSDMEMYISSADFMTRNTERRVEIAAPVEDPQLQKRILAYFGSLLRDNQKRRRLRSDGTLERIDLQDSSPYNSQAVCIREAEKDHFVPQKKHSIFERLRRGFRRSI